MCRFVPCRAWRGLGSVALALAIGLVEAGSLGAGPVVALAGPSEGAVEGAWPSDGASLALAKATPALGLQTRTAQRETPLEAERGPVPVPEPTEKALRYYRSGMWLWGAETLLYLLIPALILFSGISARIWSAARRVARPWLLATGLFAILYFTLDWLLTLPFSYYAGFVRPHAYDLSNQSFGQWFGDSVKTLLFTFPMAAVLVPILYTFLRRSRTRWWAYAALVAALTVAFIQVVYPVWVAPAFDDFGPMQDKALEQDILALADRAGIEAERVFEVNKSEDTEIVNAYVTGLLGTRRIVLWDTAIRKLDHDQILFVMGHEMGHYVLKHLWYSVAWAALTLTLLLYLAHRTMGALVRRFHDRFGFDDVAMVPSLPLVLLIVGAFGFALQPLNMAFSRWQEHESDRFALEITRDNHAGASSFAVVQQTNLGNPDPGLVYRVFRAGHPVLKDRIEFCNSYRPWERGEPLKYGHLFGTRAEGT